MALGRDWKPGTSLRGGENWGASLYFGKGEVERVYVYSLNSLTEGGKGET